MKLKGIKKNLGKTVDQVNLDEELLGKTKSKATNDSYDSKIRKFGAFMKIPEGTDMTKIPGEIFTDENMGKFLCAEGLQQQLFSELNYCRS